MATTGPDNTKPKSQSTKGEAGEKMSDLTLQPQLQAHLGRSLKAVYEALVEEPVPQKLLDLLDELERKEKEKNQNSS
jgi:Anti-sigma factor NepR